MGLNVNEWKATGAIGSIVIGVFAAVWTFQGYQVSKHAAAISEQENLTVFTKRLWKKLDDPSEYDRTAHGLNGLIGQIPTQTPPDIERRFGAMPGYPIKPEEMLLSVALTNNGASAITALYLQFPMTLSLRSGCVFNSTPDPPSLVTTASAPINSVVLSGSDSRSPAIIFSAKAELPIAPGSSRTFAFKNTSRVQRGILPVTK